MDLLLGCQPYRAKTKGKVERFNSYLKGNFYRPLAIKLKDAKLEVNHQILNQYINGWLRMANSRIHGTTGRMPVELFNEEITTLIPYLRERSPQVIVKPTARTKGLPDTVVQKTNLVQYDLLLSGVAA